MPVDDHVANRSNDERCQLRPRDESEEIALSTESTAFTLKLAQFLSRSKLFLNNSTFNAEYYVFFFAIYHTAKLTITLCLASHYLAVVMGLGD